MNITGRARGCEVNFSVVRHICLEVYSWGVRSSVSQPHLALCIDQPLAVVDAVVDAAAPLRTWLLKELRLVNALGEMQLV